MVCRWRWAYLGVVSGLGTEWCTYLHYTDALDQHFSAVVSLVYPGRHSIARKLVRFFQKIPNRIISNRCPLRRSCVPGLSQYHTLP